MKQLFTIISITVVIIALLLGGLLWVVRTTGAADVMTWNEYQELISMYNYEIEKMGGTVTLQNTSDGIIEALHAKIRSRAVVSGGNIMGKSFTKSQYSNKREALMKKAEL